MRPVKTNYPKVLTMSDKSIRRQIQERLGYETRPSSCLQYKDSEEYLENGYWYVIPFYEIWIDHAWQLVEKMTACEYVKVFLESSHYHGYHCRVVSAHESQRNDTDIVRRDASSGGTTMPFAICWAFLEATAK